MTQNPLRTQSLASCYENALTIILRLSALNQQSVANSQDFRYIYPSLASFCGLLGLMVERYLAHGNKGRAYAGLAMAALFSGSSVFVFLG